MATVYSDLDFNFTRHPVTGDVARRLNNAAVKESIKNLVRTRFYDRKFNSALGSTAANLLFENYTPIIGTLIEQTIKEVVRNYEPRAEIIKVDTIANIDANDLRLTIYYKTIEQSLVTTLEIILKRTR